MGFEMHHQAIPAGCGLIERARSDISFGEMLCIVPLIAAHVRAPQGAPVRYVVPTDVKAIARLLEPMSVEGLRQHFVPHRLEADGAYGFRADWPDQWQHICEYFEGFRSFYWTTVVRDEGIIVCLD
jgi:hypothetical protein